SSAPRGLTPQGRTALARLPGKRGARLEQAQAATASSTQAHASPTTETGQPGYRLPRTPATRPRALPQATPVGKTWDRQQRQVAPGTQRTRTGRSGALAAIRSSSAVKMPSRRSGWKSTITQSRTVVCAVQRLTRDIRLICVLVMIGRPVGSD